VRIDFFNYGEAFLHKRAVEMCEYIKARFPQVYLYTSTNGLAFRDGDVKRLVHSGIDEVTFSIDGATPESYAVYRQRGDFDKALRNLRLAVDAKRKAGRDVPFINWRYILFSHNDSDAEMNRARELATEIGVDRLSWELTDHPEDLFSRRFAPGQPDHAAIKHEIWDDNGLGNAIPGATPRADIEVHGPLPGLPVIARPGRSIDVQATITNRSERAFPARASYGRRLVRLGAQLCDAQRNLLDRDFERAWLPDALQPGASVCVPMRLTAPDKPGRFTLKFDLVCEGIDWFEQCGSPPTVKPLWVIGF
jgi:hypothetical protein